MTKLDPPIEVINRCRLCGGTNLDMVMGLGPMVVSDFVKREEVSNGVECPIELVLCCRCLLPQLRHTVPAQHLYRFRYWYRSGVTQTMCNALQNVVDDVSQRVSLHHGDAVVDIGSNDGTLLRLYQQPGLVKIGVEPAQNLHEEGSQGIDYLIKDLWSYEAYRQTIPTRIKPRVITACGMLYDLERPVQFMQDVARVLHPEGLFVAQLMCLRNMVNINDLGNFAHEHLEYYTLHSLNYLAHLSKLCLVDIEQNDVNGQSYRLYFKHRDNVTEVDEEVMRVKCNGMQQQETKDGFSGFEFYKKWQDRLTENKMKCVDFITREKRLGKSIWVLGASTKGNTILQWYGLNYPTISGASERSPEKWGLHTVSTGIPIYSEQTARSARPDYFLILPYTFLKEIIQREKQYLLDGGKFIVPLPEFHVVGKEILEN